VLLFTGKGGVGKTTTAAATAALCSERGHRTLVLSTDPAHSLGDAFGTRLGDRPVALGNGLFGQELDARLRLEQRWGELRSFLARLLDWTGVDAVEAEELTLLPGLDELLALVDIVDLAESAEWDVLVVDCAPTAETLRLLSLPDILAWWMNRLFPLSRTVARLVAPVAATVTDVPIPTEPVFAAMERFYLRLDAVRRLLADSQRTSARLVVTPEQVVVAEARRTLTYLSLFGYRVDAIVANRLLPDAVADPWFDRWRIVHAEQLATIEEDFAPLPVLRSDLAAEEPVGLDKLLKFGRAIYGGRDPADKLHDGEVLDVRSEGDRFVLRLTLPFSERRDVGLVRRGDELIVSVGPYRRALMLPDSLRRRQVVDAALDHGMLAVTFA
jgi:arsenite-transporting ATPase